MKLSQLFACKDSSLTVMVMMQWNDSRLTAEVQILDQSVKLWTFKLEVPRDDAVDEDDLIHFLGHLSDNSPENMVEVEQQTAVTETELKLTLYKRPAAFLLQAEGHGSFHAQILQPINREADIDHLETTMEGVWNTEFYPD